MNSRYVTSTRTPVTDADSAIPCARVCARLNCQPENRADQNGLADSADKPLTMFSLIEPELDRQAFEKPAPNLGPNASRRRRRISDWRVNG